MSIFHYDYIDGDELSNWQYVRQHLPSSHCWFWHFKYATKRSWLKKCLFFNLFSINGIIISVCFIFSIFLTYSIVAAYPIFILIPILACVPWIFDFTRTYYYSFVKPKDIEATLLDFVKSNRLEVIYKPSLDRYIVRKDGYELELSYAYDDIWIRDLFNRKNLIVIKACYKTTDQSLINQHGLVTLPFEQKFNEYCATLAPGSDILLDEHHICALLPIGTSRSVTGKAVTSIIDVLNHFGLTVISPTSRSASRHIMARPATAGKVTFYLLLIFVMIFGRIYLSIERGTAAQEVPESVAIQTIPHYYLSQNGVKLSRYEPDTLLFYATITYNASNERGAICVTIDDETQSDTALDTLGYYRMHNMVILVSASQGLSSEFIEPVIGTNVLSGLPPISLMKDQSDSISTFRSDYYLNEEGRLRDRKSYNE